jgi:nucleoid-associated protein YgaU
MQDDSKRWDDSLISLGLGALVVVVSGILIYNYFSGQTAGFLQETQKANSSAAPSAQVAQIPAQTGSAAPSSSAAPSKTPSATTGTATLPAKHTVAAGESFWKISERYYGTGYEWKRIAEANNMLGKSLNPGAVIDIPRAELISATSTEKSPAPTQIAQVKPTDSPKASATVAPTATAIAKASPTNTPAAVANNQQVKPEVAPTGSISYTVAKGDTLWKIASEKCNNPYAWSSIARQNKLAAPGVIHTGNTFTFTCTQ